MWGRNMNKQEEVTQQACLELKITVLDAVNTICRLGEVLSWGPTQTNKIVTALILLTLLY